MLTVTSTAAATRIGATPAARRPRTRGSTSLSTELLIVGGLSVGVEPQDGVDLILGRRDLVEESVVVDDLGPQIRCACARVRQRRQPVPHQRGLVTRRIPTVATHRHLVDTT